MAKHIKVVSRPSKLQVVLPEDPRPARTHSGSNPSTGVSGRGSLVSPQDSEGATPRGTLRVSKPKNTGRVHAIGPAENVLP